MSGDRLCVPPDAALPSRTSQTYRHPLDAARPLMRFVKVWNFQDLKRGRQRSSPAQRCAFNAPVRRIDPKMNATLRRSRPLITAANHAHPFFDDTPARYNVYSKRRTVARTYLRRSGPFCPVLRRKTCGTTNHPPGASTTPLQSAASIAAMNASRKPSATPNWPSSLASRKSSARPTTPSSCRNSPKPLKASSLLRPPSWATRSSSSPSNHLAHP
jgi:hypothetical protein